MAEKKGPQQESREQFKKRLMAEDEKTWTVEEWAQNLGYDDKQCGWIADALREANERGRAEMREKCASAIWNAELPTQIFTFNLADVRSAMASAVRALSTATEQKGEKP